MKFMLIVHHDEAAFEKIDKEKRQQMLAESIDLTHQLHATGQYVHASPLQPAATAVMVKVREGKSLVTDGPFIETREQIAGYFLINARELNEAVSIAGRVPGARIGTVEVRPLIEITGLPNEYSDA
ncbi:MAG TPA: YciI family protein [Nitrospira sp.]